MGRLPRITSDDDYWEEPHWIPPGEPIYGWTEPPYLSTGTAHQLNDKPCRKRSRPIGFRPPQRPQTKKGAK